MRSAFENQPSPMNARVTVTAIVVALAIAVFELQGKSFSDFVIDPAVWPGEPWRFFTTVFVHGGALHLLFNVYMMWRLGAQVEEEYGTLRTLGFLVLFAVVPLAAEWGLFRGGVGLSGVVYGWFGMRWALSRFHPDHRTAMPERVVEMMVLWFFVCIALTYFDVMPIANVAHGVGGLIGYLTGWALSPARLGAPQALRRTAPALRWSAVVALGVLSLSAATFGRRYVNLSPSQRRQIHFNEGLEAFEAKDYEASIQAFSHALSGMEGGRDGSASYNIGLAYYRLGQREKALEFVERAVQIEPEDEQYRTLLQQLTR